MTTTHDPYATEAETDALLAADTRTPAERRLAALFDQHGGNEQGAEPEAVLRRIALELIEAQGPQPAGRATMQQAQEAVAWACWADSQDPSTHKPTITNYKPSAYTNVRPLVYGDTAPPQRQPLTDEQAAAVVGNVADVGGGIRILRAIEAAHNITKGPAA